MRSPQEIVEYVNHSAYKKEKTPTKKLIILGIIAGVYISMGALLSIIIGYGFPEAAKSNPAIIKLLMGATFPVGLIMIVLAGGELFTGCCAYFVPNVLSRRQRAKTMVKYCSIVWITNFIGALLFGYFVVYLPHLSHYEPTIDGFMSIAQAKTSNPFYVTMLKGIGANWLVCLAMWLGMSSKSVTGKILGLWFPVMTFVAIGYEHSVANMFFLPIAMLEGFELSVVELFTKNLIPATLGNIIGGTLFVGGVYWYLYDSKNSQKH
ncbi:MAG: formate/nitrite transporter family protein [Rikenellaceae bacterium]